jgi:hypothetical protein
MALSTKKHRITSARNSDRREVHVQFNALCDLLRAWAVTMDADSGITATTFTATLEAAVFKIHNEIDTAPAIDA